LCEEVLFFLPNFKAQAEEKLTSISQTSPQIAIATEDNQSRQVVSTSAKDLLAQQSNVTRVTGVEIQQTNQGLEVVLKTAAGSQKLVPLILPEGNKLAIDILDATLGFSIRNGVTKANPAPRIKAVSLAKILAIAPVISYKFSDDTSLSFEYEYLESNLTADDGLPIDPAIFEIPRERFLGDPDDFIDTKTHSFYLTLDHRFNENINLRSGFTAQISDDSTSFLRLSEFDPESGQFSRFFNEGEAFGNNYSWQTDLIRVCLIT
jgi:hypothetical protein